MDFNLAGDTDVCIVRSCVLGQLDFERKDGKDPTRQRKTATSGPL